MDFQVFYSNKSLPQEQLVSAPIFSRLAWFSLFEEFICNDNIKAKSFVFIKHDSQFILPLAIYENQLKSLTNYYSPFYRMLGSSPVTANICQQAIQSCQDELKNYDTVDLLPLYEEDAENFKYAFESIGFKGFTYLHSINWYHENITDIDQYWSLRPSKLLNTLKRKKRKLEKMGGYSVVMSTAKNAFDLNKELADYHHVYFDSWKKVEPYPAFIDAIVNYAWQQGELRLGLVYHKEKPVAAQIWFVNNKTAYIFKLAYRSNYTKTSVGTILTAAMMEHVIEQDKVSSIDFLTGDDNYKKDWMQSHRPLMGIQFCNPTTWKGKKAYFRNILSGIRK